jgi:hypothetical protein
MFLGKHMEISKRMSFLEQVDHSRSFIKTGNSAYQGTSDNYFLFMFILLNILNENVIFYQARVFFHYQSHIDMGGGGNFISIGFFP